MYGSNEDVKSNDYNRDRGTAVLYTHVREFGRPVYHRVRLFGSYTRAQGCGGHVLFEREGTIAEVLKDLRGLAKNNVLSKEQVKRVHELMSERNDGIITADLQFHNC